MTGGRTKTAALVAATLALGGVVAGCGGGGDGRPASTAKDGALVFDPDHTVVNVAPGPRVVVQMPVPADGTEWRLFSSPDDMGGVSLKGIENADGAGRWTFDTIGGGSGVLEFRQMPVGSQDYTESVTYEVNVK